MILHWSDVTVSLPSTPTSQTTVSATGVTTTGSISATSANLNGGRITDLVLVSMRLTLSMLASLSRSGNINSRSQPPTATSPRCLRWSKTTVVVRTLASQRLLRCLVRPSCLTRRSTSLPTSAAIAANSRLLVRSACWSLTTLLSTPVSQPASKAMAAHPIAAGSPSASKPPQRLQNKERRWSQDQRRFFVWTSRDRPMLAQIIAGQSCSNGRLPHPAPLHIDLLTTNVGQTRHINIQRRMNPERGLVRVCGGDDVRQKVGRNRIVDQDSASAPL